MNGKIKKGREIISTPDPLWIPQQGLSTSLVSHGKIIIKKFDHWVQYGRFFDLLGGHIGNYCTVAAIKEISF